jgi:hypothetical protein
MNIGVQREPNYSPFIEMAQEEPQDGTELRSEIGTGLVRAHLLRTSSDLGLFGCLSASLLHGS